jgi:hypothetical protein
MPVFPDRESALVARLKRDHTDTEDKRTWVIGGVDANTEISKAKPRGRPHGAASSPLAVDATPSHLDEIRAGVLSGGGVVGESMVSLTPSMKDSVSDATLYSRLLVSSSGLLHRSTTSPLEIGLVSEVRDSLV